MGLKLCMWHMALGLGVLWVHGKVWKLQPGKHLSQTTCRLPRAVWGLDTGQWCGPAGRRAQVDGPWRASRGALPIILSRSDRHMCPPQALGSGTATCLCCSLNRGLRLPPLAVKGRSQAAVLATQEAQAPLNIQISPEAGLAIASRPLQPQGKPHPRAKVFLLFENILVPGSHPWKVPESAGPPHPSPLHSRSTQDRGGNSGEQDE